MLPSPRSPSLKAAGVVLAGALAAPLAQASNPTDPTHPAWQRCTALADSAQRLACFDAWAGQQAWQAPAASSAQAAPQEARSAQPDPVDTTLPATRMIEVAQVEGCRDTQYSELSRFWELEMGSSCGTFRFRGYRPLSASVVASDSGNRQPSSPAPEHTALSSVAYRSTEARLQLSVRTKIAQSLLT